MSVVDHGLIGRQRIVSTVLMLTEKALEMQLEHRDLHSVNTIHIAHRTTIPQAIFKQRGNDNSLSGVAHNEKKLIKETVIFCLILT